jgi:hypothetical protein
VGGRLQVPIDGPSSVFLVNRLHDERHVPGLFFPWQLHQMLDEAAENEDVRENVISWQSDNISFSIHDKEQFLSKVLSKHLPGITWDEFMRRLSGWGFVRFTSGPQKGTTFVHRLLVRGKRGLCKQMRIKGKTVRHHLVPTVSFRLLLALNFESSFFHLQVLDLFKNQGEFLVHLHGLLDFLEKENKQSIISWSEDGKAFIISDTKTFINDIFPSYFEPFTWSSFEKKLRAWGFTRTPTRYSKDVAPTYLHPGFARDRTPTFVRASERMKGEAIRPDHSFLIRLRVILDDAHRHGYQMFVSWLPHGKAFAVHDRPHFANTIMPLYFKNKFNSFRHSLRSHGFAQMGGSGWDEGVYYHKLFVRDDPCVCQYLTEKQMKEAMPEWIPPSEEPDFYSSVTNGDDSTLDITEIVPLCKPCLPKPIIEDETRPAALPLESSKDEEDYEEGVVILSPTKQQSPQSNTPPTGTPGTTPANTPPKPAGMLEAAAQAENSDTLSTLLERIFQSNAQRATFGLSAPNSGKECRH